MDNVKTDFSVDNVKEQIVNTALVITASLGILAYLFSFYTRFTDSGFNISSLFETITLLSILIITIRRKYFKTTFKAYTLLFFSIFISLSDAYVFGMMGSVSIYLLIIPLLSIIYFSVIQSILFFLVAISGYIFIGYMHHTGVFQITAGYEPSIHVLRFNPWIIRAIHISAIGFILLYITLKYFQSFSRLIVDLEQKNMISSVNERNYREIFNSTSEAIFLHNSKDGKIIDVNDIAIRMFGYNNKDEIINQTVEDLSDGNRDELQKRVQTLINKAVNDGPLVFEWLSRRKNGEVFHSEISLKGTEIGGKGRVLAVLRDISKRKKSEEELSKSEARLSIVFRLTPVAIAIADIEDQNRLLDVNDAFIKTTGYSKTELIGNTYQEKKIWAYPKEYEKAAAIFRQNKQLYDFEFHFRCKDGTIRMGKISTEIAQIAGRQCLVTATVDITQQKKIESQLIAARISSELNSANQKAILENTTDNIWAIDTNYKIIYSNKIFYSSFKREFGVEIGPGTNLLYALPEASRPAWKNRYDQALANQQFTFEEIIDTQNGKLAFQVSMNPILNEGRVIGVSCFANDISQRKKSEVALRESEEKFRIIFENSPLGIFRFDKDGIINECNIPLTKIIGSSKDDILNLSLFHLPDIRIHEACREVLKGKPAYFEGYYQSLFSDKITPVRFFFAPIINPQGTVEGGICLAEDRTFLLQKEEYRKQAQIARESVKFKQNFLANMSHEIRTPLTGVLGMIDIMEKTDLSEKQKDYINTLKISGENLKEIINQVLDYSKIEAGKMSLKYSVVELRSLLSGAENLFKNMAKPGVTFSTQMDENIPDLFLADRNRIAQVVNNLVSNALKFTEKGSVKIIANLVALNNANNQLTLKIEVADTGIGIQESMLDKLFTPFSQIDAQENQYREGTGLGLTISRELVKMHGGEMGVKSQYKKGSTFWFTFVATTPKSTDHKPVANMLTASFTNSPLRILYAEDKKINQKVVKIMLSSLGHKVTIANDGEHAVRLYQPGKFDLILMDIQMPVMDGIRATQELKKKYQSLPPGIGLSANAFEGDREKYMDLGMDEYLTKPMVLDDFIQVVNRVI